jgi:hypothetical protein
VHEPALLGAWVRRIFEAGGCCATCWTGTIVPHAAEMPAPVFPLVTAERRAETMAATLDILTRAMRGELVPSPDVQTDTPFPSAPARMGTGNRCATGFWIAAHKRVCASGRIEMYRGSPEMVLHDPAKLAPDAGQAGRTADPQPVLTPALTE